MKSRMKFLQIIFLLCLCFYECTTRQNAELATSGNPLFEGWYADPEGAVFGNTYWIFPTYSAAYDKQVFFDAFSSTDLVNWKKHPHVLDTSNVHWAKQAMIVHRVPPVPIAPD